MSILNGYIRDLRKIGRVLRAKPRGHGFTLKGHPGGIAAVKLMMPLHWKRLRENAQDV